MNPSHLFKLSNAVCHAADGAEAPQVQHPEVLVLQTLPVVVAQPAVLKQCSDTTLAGKERADAVGAFVAEVDDRVEGRADGDLGGRLSQFPD